MKYIEIEKRQLTSNVGQYRYMRRENKDAIKLLGKFPVLADELNVRTIKAWNFGDFVLKKISYNIESKLRVRAYLLMPVGASGCPGIIAAHQHNDEFKAGKSEVVGLVKNPEYQKLEPVPPGRDHKTVRPDFSYARELCKRGYVVLAPDMLAFEEHRESSAYFDRFFRSYENIAARKYLMRGSCLLAKYMHDLYVAVSVLQNMTGVEKEKVGIIGHSLGGEQAIFAALFDARIVAGVSSCGFSGYLAADKYNQYESASAVIPNFLEEDRDMNYFLGKIKPAPFMITVGKKEKSFREQEKICRRAKYKGLKIVNFDGGHSFPRTIRLQAYDFIDAILRRQS